MAPEVMVLVKPLVDVQPVYNVMPLATNGPEAYGPEVRALVRTKLKEAAKSLRETARYIDKQLAESDA